MPTQKDVINCHFVRHKQTRNEIYRYDRLNVCLVFSLNCSIYIMTFCAT